MSKYITPPTNTNDINWFHSLYLRLIKSLSFSATLVDNDQTGIVSAVNTKLVFDTKEWDTTGGLDITGTKWTCKETGIYEFNVSILGSTSYFIYLYKNGSVIAISPYAALTTVTKILNLNTNDYIEVYVLQVSGSDKTITKGATTTYFQGKRVT